MDLSTRDGRKELGNRIKQAARLADLSLEDLATRVGCSRALIYQYVSGASLVQPDRLQLIGREVKRSLAWFFADDGDAVIPSETAPTPPTRDADHAEAAPGDEGRRLRERIAHLHVLVSAYAGPPDWRGVADTCQQLLPLLEHEEDRGAVAETLLMQGEALIQLQEMGPAKQKLEAAGALFRDLDIMDRALACLQSLGNVNVQQGRAEEALHQFRQVAGGESWTRRWQGALSLGAVHEVLGNYAQAAEQFVRAQEVVDESDSPQATDIGRLYIDANWANLELDWGDYPDAAERADHCVLLAQRLGAQDQYIEALLTRGLALLGLRELAPALAEIQRALHVAQLTRDHARWSLALACRALGLSACQRPADALTDGKEALAIALRCGATRAEMLAQRALAEAYLAAENRREAGYHIAQASAIAASLRVRQPQAQFLVLTARWERDAGRLREAGDAASDALSRAEALDAKAVRHDAHLELARIALADGRWQDAMTHAERAVSLTDAMRVPLLAWQAQSVIAQARAQSGEPEEARAAFTQALGLLAQNRRRCLEAAGTDTLLEDREALDLWRQWLRFLIDSGQGDEAEAQAVAADWPPLRRQREEHTLDDQRRDDDAHA